MNSFRETDAHQRAKAAILNGCAHAGYQAVTEASGEGWRVDVMASRGNVRIAFEVQWSPQKLRETVARQERYARDGVRGCWFFRQPPAMLERADTLKARRDLPLFHLFANADGSFVVRLGGRLTPLDIFVSALLTQRVRFCEEVTAAETQTMSLGFYPVRCDACGRTGHVYRLLTPLRARCGHVVPLTGEEAQFAAGRGEFLAAARTAVRDQASIRLAQVVFADNALTVRCPHCAAAYPARRLAMAGYGEQPILTLPVEVDLRRPLTVRSPHWCFPAHGEMCC
ncbi:MAG: hypothetical protein IPK19_15850 [Chloroflexi bacterium]|nr:hypothetical protein [Chloroflexota bacterium]